MIPILFDVNTTDFTTNGIGRLSNAKTCKVTEERNGEYELKLTYPVGGVYFDEIQNERIVVAKPFKNGTNQAFRIYSITDKLDGNIEVLANHISYDANFIPIDQISLKTGIAASITAINNAAITTNPFTLSQIGFTNTTSRFSSIYPKSLRSVLGGTEGSLLDVFSSHGHGEYEWDNFNIKFHYNRGSDKGYAIRYAKNLTEYDREREDTSAVAGCIAYFIEEDDVEGGNVTVLKSTVQYAETEYVRHGKVITVDATEDFDEVPTLSDLNNYAKAYADDANTPKESIDVEFVDLGDADINLCDTVNVRYSRFLNGKQLSVINFRSKVIKTVWDVLLDRYDKVTIGDNRSSLGDTLDDKIDENAKAAAAKVADRKIISVVQYVDQEVGQAVSSINAVEEHVGELETTVTNQGTQILQNTNEIALRATYSEVTQQIDENIGINLSPFFGHPFNDLRNSSTNPSGYWHTITAAPTTNGTGYTQLTDGWARVIYSNPSSASSNVWALAYVAKDENFTDNSYTLLVEVKDCTKTGTVSAWTNSSSSAKQQYKGSGIGTSIFTNGTFRITVNKNEPYSTASRLVEFGITLQPGSSIDAKIRVSMYKANYAGDYVPYAATENSISIYNSKQTQAAIELASDSILAQVSSVEQEIIKTTGVNLQPLFSHPYSDIYDVNSNPNGYWYARTGWSNLEDGWADVNRDNTSGTGIIYMYGYPIKNANFTENNYTLLIEVKDVVKTGTPSFWFSSYSGSPSQYTGTGFNVANGTFTVRLTKTSTAYSSCGVLFRFGMSIPAGAKITCKVRASLYKDGYLGQYIPYITDHDYLEDSLKSLTTTTNEANSTILQLSDQISANVTEITRVESSIAGVAKNEAKTLISSSETYMSSQIDLKADAMNLTISSIQTDVSNNSKSISEMHTYFTFASNGITVGKSDSDIRGVFGNTSLDFIDKQGNKLAWLSASEGLGADGLSLGSATDTAKRWKVIVSFDGNTLRFTRHQ